MLDELGYLREEVPTVLHAGASMIVKEHILIL
jgi:hypothetical protein